MIAITSAEVFAALKAGDSLNLQNVITKLRSGNTQDRIAAVLMILAAALKVSAVVVPAEAVVLNDVEVGVEVAEVVEPAIEPYLAPLIDELVRDFDMFVAGFSLKLPVFVGPSAPFPDLSQNANGG